MTSEPEFPRRRFSPAGGFQSATTVNGMKTGVSPLFRLVLSAIFVVASNGVRAEDTTEPLEFPPLSDGTNSVANPDEALTFSPLPFEDSVSLSNPPEKPESANAVLSAIGMQDSSVSPEATEAVLRHAIGGGKTPIGATPVVKTDSSAKKNSALAALAAAVAELPPAEKSASKTDEPAPKQRPVQSMAPASGVETVDGIVRVSVFIDVPFEGIKRPEGTAMLRTKGWLRKTFPDLPREFSISGRVTTNGFDEDERVYRYCTEYWLKDIEKLFPRKPEMENVTDEQQVTSPLLSADNDSTGPSDAEEPEALEIEESLVSTLQETESSALDVQSEVISDTPCETDPSANADESAADTGSVDAQEDAKENTSAAP